MWNRKKFKEVCEDSLQDLPGYTLKWEKREFVSKKTKWNLNVCWRREVNLKKFQFKESWISWSQINTIDNQGQLTRLAKSKHSAERKSNWAEIRDRLLNDAR